MKRIIPIFRTIFGHSVARNSLIVLSGSMIANALAYLYHLVVGRILGPERYGELAALLSLFYLLNVLSQGFGAVMTKYFSGFKAREQTGEAKSLFIISTRWMILIIVIGLCISFFSLNTLSDFLHISAKENFIWLYLIFSSYLISVVQLSTYQAYQLFLASNILANFGTALRLVFGAVGAFFGVGATLVSNIFSNLIMYVIGLFPLKFILSVKARPLSISKRSALEYSIPALITTFGLTALYSQDVLLVKHFFLSKDAGIYSSLSVLGKVIFYASSALGFVLFPVVAERKELNRGHKRIVWTGLVVIAAISLVLTTFYFLFPRLVVDMLFGKAFYEAVPYVGFFGLFITFFSLSSLLFNVCLAAEKTAVWILATLGALSQALLIWMYHQTLLNVIMVNLTVSITLFILLLLYYSYAKEQS